MAPKILPRGAIPKFLIPQPQMTPPSEYGIGSLGPDSWSMGSSMLCEKVGQSTAAAADEITTWKDTDGTWRLRRRDPPLTATSTPPGDSDVNRTYFCGNAAAMWLISPNVLCKVKGWIPGVALEAETIKWVTQNTNIPVPNVIYSWIDPAWHRSFCLMYVVPGKTLDEAWSELSKEERTAIASEVATYVTEAAQHISPTISTAVKTGILFHGWILGSPKPEMAGATDWQPDLQTVMTPEQFDERLLLIKGRKGPEEVDHFVFFHGDLAPCNIFVDKDNDKWHVSSIIDWETAGFLPKWYIRSIVGLSPAYLLNQKDLEEASAWSFELFRLLGEHGFPEYRKWLYDLRFNTRMKPHVYVPRASG
ncbi:MAG: hypothetical protein LQ342_001554 [Letrouitia transgressa]|nr:MAG: hypothetical protein LQ342_001554 [Letrouitia transgressa]